MGTLILSGKPVAKQIKLQLTKKIEILAKSNIIPGLAAVIVGNDSASEVYVNSKSKAFAKMNCYSQTYRLPEDSKEIDVINLIKSLNDNQKYHGILIQLPLPKHLDSQKILNSVSSLKDVDGFHPMNLGKLLEGNPNFIPCTPNGIIEILKFYNIKTLGKHVVIVGRSNIVGKPMFALLSQKFEKGNATVTICHTKTKDISYHTRQADIIIAAVGVPKFITSEMIKDDVILIDVGINYINDKSVKGYHLVGDVDFESIQAKAQAVTPVPGGVGPMTITMLLYNTVKSAETFCK